MLELAILGLLNEAPVHGYELRKQLGLRLGGFRVFSYGSLYPALRRLTRAGLIVEGSGTRPAGGGLVAPGRRVYQITAEGKERLTELLSDSGRQCWDDDGFGVHLAFFSRTPAEARMRILEGRRRTWRSAGRACGPHWPGPGRRSTATPASCTSWGWTPPSARCGGSTS